MPWWFRSVSWVVFAGCAAPRSPLVEAPLAEFGPICAGSPYSTIQAAIDAAASGDTVTVCDGTFAEHLAISAKTLTLVSEHGAAVTAVDATATGIGIEISGGANVTIDGFTIQNGATPGTGGDVQCTGSTLNLLSSTLVDGTANSGGGIGATNCSGSIEGNTFDSNSAYQGGALYVVGDGLSIEGNTLVSNHADFAGGAVYLDGDSPILWNAATQNDSDLYGGAIYVTDDDGAISGNTFADNTSVDDGAGLYVAGGTAAVSDNQFVGNQAGDDGGGLRLKLSSATVTDNDFDSNVADNMGGGCKISHQATTVSGNTFTDNTAWVGAGGLLLEESASTASNNTFTGNFAPDGGALSIVDGWDHVVVEDSTFARNSASGNGGAIYVDVRGQVVELHRVNVSANTANRGGGLYLTETNLSASNTVFRKNQAVDGGAAIWLDGATGDLTNDVLFANDAPNGSGLRIENGKTLAVDNCAITNNTGSAAVWLEWGAQPGWSYSDVYANSAGFHGMPDQTGLNGNLSVKPQFVSAVHGDFHLSAGSPLVDVGDPAISDQDGSRSDIGRWGGPDAH